MKFKDFVEIAEFKTQIINISWMFLAMGYVNFTFGKVAMWYPLVFLAAIVLFHSGIIMLDNYTDNLKNRGDDEYERKNNVMYNGNVSLKAVRNSIIVILIFGIICGLYLVYLAGPTVLILGIIGYLLGLGYSNGPIPINHWFGSELIIACAIGFLNILTFAYVELVEVGIKQPFWTTFFNVLIVCAGPICLVWLSLLTNNLADYEIDIANNRKTLVYYFKPLGIKMLIPTLYWLSAVLMICMVIIGKAPLIILLTVIWYPILAKNVYKLIAQPSKDKTYPLIVKTISLILLTYNTLFLIGSFIKI